MCFVYGAGKDDGRLAGELVEKIDEVEVLVFVGEEEIGLEEGGDCLVFVCRYGNAEGVGEGGALKGFHFGGHGCGEEVSASFFREDFEDFVEDGTEVQIQETVCFVHD